MINLILIKNYGVILEHQNNHIENNWDNIRTFLWLTSLENEITKVCVDDYEVYEVE